MMFDGFSTADPGVATIRLLTKILDLTVRPGY